MENHKVRQHHVKRTLQRIRGDKVARTLTRRWVQVENPRSQQLLPSQAMRAEKRLILISVEAVLFKFCWLLGLGPTCFRGLQRPSPSSFSLSFNTKCHPSFNQPFLLDHIPHGRCLLWHLCYPILNPSACHLELLLCSQQTLPDSYVFLKHFLHLLALTKIILFPEDTASTARFLSAILSYHTLFRVGVWLPTAI